MGWVADCSAPLLTASEAGFTVGLSGGVASSHTRRWSIDFTSETLRGNQPRLYASRKSLPNKEGGWWEGESEGIKGAMVGRQWEAA